MNGWHGYIIRVDLSRSSAVKEKLSEELLVNYLGGRGLGARLLRESCTLDPFASDMPLVFAAGPLTGTMTPMTERISLCSRSPLTGTVMENSLTGDFAAAFKRCGIDALVISGKSERPVTLRIKDDCVAIESAEQLWGRGTEETFAGFADSGRVAAIGPAGENGVLFASVALQGSNIAGRGGLGAVMGAKRLKAIAVEGHLGTTIADPQQFDQALQDVWRLFRASPFLCGPLGISRFGTPVLVDLMAQRRMTPAANFRSTVFEGAAAYAATVLQALYGAAVQRDGEQPGFGPMVGNGGLLPEYEALSHFGALNMIDDPQVIVRASRQCNDLGMDPVSAAAVIACFGELRGRFVEAEELEAVLADIAALNGDGAMLAQGARRLASNMGRPELAMTVKSLELPAYDPRGAYGLALGYCTSTRGGCHLQSYPLSHEILRKPVPTDRFSFSGKARMNAVAEDAIAVIDSLKVGGLSLVAASLEEYAELLTAVTGVAYSPGRLLGIGRCIRLMERFYNCANGFSRCDDLLPARFFSEPGSSGDGVDIPPVDRQRFEEELDKYYRICGLNPQGCFDDTTFLEKQP